MIDIIFLGADVPSNRVILTSAGAGCLGVSFWGLQRRGLPKNKKYELKNYFPEDVRIYVNAGLPLKREFSKAELEEFAADYEQFIAENIDSIAGFTEVDHPGLPSSFIEEQRVTVWSDVPEDKFCPVFRAADGVSLDSLAVRYLNVAVPGELVENDTKLIPLIRRLHQQHGTTFHAIAAAKPDNLRQMPVATASTLSWLSPMMRGETIVWNGSKLVRYPKRMKEQARPRYKAIYERAGLDFDKILSDDAVEISKLAVWSYLQYQDWVNRLGADIVTMSEWSDVEQSGESTPNEVTMRGGGMRKLEPRKPEEMGVLPVLGTEVTRVVETDELGNNVIKDVTVLKSSATSLRMCDTCFVAQNCPAFKPQSTCAFNLPVEVKTKDQLKSLINALVEMQGQRVAFAKFSEDLNGGYPDPNVGQELDRFFKMLKTIKELDDSREFIRMTVERQGAGGVLSAIFGDKAQALRELPNNGLDEAKTNEIIHQVIDQDSENS
jgi:hypothetical protein